MTSWPWLLACDLENSWFLSFYLTMYAIEIWQSYSHWHARNGTPNWSAVTLFNTNIKGKKVIPCVINHVIVTENLPPPPKKIYIAHTASSKLQNRKINKILIPYDHTLCAPKLYLFWVKVTAQITPKTTNSAPIAQTSTTPNMNNEKQYNYMCKSLHQRYFRIFILPWWIYPENHFIFIRFLVMLLKDKQTGRQTARQTDKQTDGDGNITFVIWRRQLIIDILHKVKYMHIYQVWLFESSVVQDTIKICYPPHSGTHP